MENSGISDFNQKYMNRTKWFSINLYKAIEGIKKTEMIRSIYKQLIRSSTSVAANFRAAIRARSQAEYYAKICIVVEECDETYFWLDWLIDGNFADQAILELHKKEALELLSIFSMTKKKLQLKRNTNK
jgi:four helix bundle protein